MQKTILLIILSSVFLHSKAQKMDELKSRIAAIEDRMAIKNVVDTFSILADTKEIDRQVLLFTADGKVESKTNGQSMILKGREQLKQAFAGFLANFQNGQWLIATAFQILLQLKQRQPISKHSFRNTYFL